LWPLRKRKTKIFTRTTDENYGLLTKQGALVEYHLV